MPRIDTKYRWHVIYTVANHEKKIHEYLIKTGVEAFLPLSRTVRQWKDRKKPVELPLFPNYIFVYLNCREYYRILEHPSIVKYVCSEGLPVQVPDNQIQNMKRIVNGNYPYRLTRSIYKVGESVAISPGNTYQHKGKIMKIRKKDQILIILSEIGYSLVVDLAGQGANLIGSFDQ